MSQYRLTNQGVVIRLSDKACVSLTEGAKGYDEYQDWLSKGGIPFPVEEPEPFAMPPRIVSAIRGVTFADGNIATVRGLYNVGALLYLGPGQVMVVYLQSVQGDVFVSGTNGVNLSLSESAPEYCVLDMRNAGGELADAALLDVILSVM